MVSRLVGCVISDPSSPNYHPAFDRGLYGVEELPLAWTSRLFEHRESRMQLLFCRVEEQTDFVDTLSRTLKLIARAEKERASGVVKQAGEPEEPRKKSSPTEEHPHVESMAGVLYPIESNGIF